MKTTYVAVTSAENVKQPSQENPEANQSGVDVVKILTSMDPRLRNKVFVFSATDCGNPNPLEFGS